MNCKNTTAVSVPPQWDKYICTHLSGNPCDQPTATSSWLECSRWVRNADTQQRYKSVTFEMYCACSPQWANGLSGPVLFMHLPTGQRQSIGDNSQGHGLTSESPCAAAALYASAGALSCFSSADEVLAGPRCSELESMPFPVPLDAEWLWEVVSCSLAIDSMTWDFSTKAWTGAGSLCADRQMCLPLVFTVTWGLCWSDASTSPKSHLLNPKITPARPCWSLTLCWPSGLLIMLRITFLRRPASAPWMRGVLFTVSAG